MSAETKYQTKKHFLSWGSIVIHTNSSKCIESEKEPSAETFFLIIKMQQVQGLTNSDTDKYWGLTVFAWNLVVALVFAFRIELC